MSDTPDWRAANRLADQVSMQATHPIGEEADMKLTIHTPHAQEAGDYLTSMFVLGLGGAFAASLLVGVGFLPAIIGGLAGAVVGLFFAE